jgi:hypothetical protein
VVVEDYQVLAEDMVDSCHDVVVVHGQKDVTGGEPEVLA